MHKKNFIFLKPNDEEISNEIKKELELEERERFSSTIAISVIMVLSCIFVIIDSYFRNKILFYLTKVDTVFYLVFFNGCI